MHLKKNGYVAGAVLLVPFAKQLREHIEYEKFLCRTIVDNEITREFKKTTDELSDQRYALRYNNPISDKLTEFGKKNGD